MMRIRRKDRRMRIINQNIYRDYSLDVKEIKFRG